MARLHPAAASPSWHTDNYADTGVIDVDLHSKDTKSPTVDGDFVSDKNDYYYHQNKGTTEGFNFPSVLTSLNPETIFK